VELAGAAGGDHRGGGVETGAVAQPGGHGDRAVELVAPVGLELADGGGDPGVETVAQGDGGDEGVPFGRQHEGVDRLSQQSEHAFDCTTRVSHNYRDRDLPRRHRAGRWQLAVGA
jgi:hypothetical protein